MKLSTFADYGLRLWHCVAATPTPRATVAEVAFAQPMPAHRLANVAQALTGKGWLVNSSGKDGGLNLATAAQCFTVAQAAHQVDDRDHKAARRLNETVPCRAASACWLRGGVDEAKQAVYVALDRHALADLAHNPQALSMLWHAKPAMRPAVRPAVRPTVHPATRLAVRLSKHRAMQTA